MNDSTSLELIWNSEFPTFGVGNTKAVPCRKAEAAAPSISEVEILQVADAVCRSTSLNSVRLTDEFYPGHLSVALIDAVFNTSKRVDRRATQILSDVARYCCRFGVARTRTVRWEMPAVARQETLGDLIRRYDASGVDRMADDVFQMRARGSSTKRLAVQSVLDAARALREIGVDVLQDVQSRHFEEIETALRRVSGVGDETVRLLLMYTGDDDFVRGDESVRRFVASALGRRFVPAHVAEELVRRAAYELVLSPRFLDFLLWECAMLGDGLAKPPELAFSTLDFDVPVVSGLGGLQCPDFILRARDWRSGTAELSDCRSVEGGPVPRALCGRGRGTGSHSHECPRGTRSFRRWEIVC